jgi:hypothetical protein
MNLGVLGYMDHACNIIKAALHISAYITSSHKLSPAFLPLDCFSFQGKK